MEDTEKDSPSGTSTHGKSTTSRDVTKWPIPASLEAYSAAKGPVLKQRPGPADQHDLYEKYGLEEELNYIPSNNN